MVSKAIDGIVIIMKFVIAPDSFKESMNAAVAAEAIEKGLKAVFPQADCRLYPMADGGEGTLHAIRHYSRDMRTLHAQVSGPLDSQVQAEMLYDPEKQEFFVEMAEAGGLMLLEKSQRNPLNTSTYGVGQMVKIALDHHPRRIVIGLGGSVTNDGGAGFLQALGVRIEDKDGLPIGKGGKQLIRTARIDPAEVLEPFRSIEVVVLSDVNNPLLGSNGATTIFSLQKGASPEMQTELEMGMAHFAEVAENVFHRSCRNLPGSGAAGGLGFALQFLPNVRIMSGIDYIAKMSGIESDLETCDAVFIGEGSLDLQSLQGKGPIGIARLAKKYHKPVIALVGRLSCTPEELKDHWIDRVYPISDRTQDLRKLLKDGPKNIEIAAKNVALSFIEDGIQ